MTSGTRTKHRFTEFKVVRVGNCVVLKAAADGDQVYGADLEVVLDFEADSNRADLYEQWFEHMVKCAEVIGDMPADALDATVILTKGRQ